MSVHHPYGDAVALDTPHLVGRLFDQLAAEHLDFTITVADRDWVNRWLQLRGNSINLPYPHDGKPEEVLANLGFEEIFGGVDWYVDDWAAGGFVTVDWGPLGEPQQEVLAGIVARMAEKYLGLSADSDRWVVSEQ